MSKGFYMEIVTKKGKNLKAIFLVRLGQVLLVTQKLVEACHVCLWLV